MDKLIPTETENRFRFTNLLDLEEQAKQRLDQPSYDFIAGGAGAELTIRANREAFEKIGIIPRVLTGIRQVDTSTTFFGQKMSMPIYVTSMSNHGVAHTSAEVGSAEGARRAGALFVAATGSNKTIEEIAQASGSSPHWFQLYYNKDMEINKSLIQRAEKAGYSAIVMTVDLPVLGLRDRDLRNRFVLASGLKRANIPSERFMNATRNLHSLVSGVKDDLSWDDYEWTRKNTQLPVLIKGILSPEDAEEAARRNVPGIIVSNHGGRQLDTAIGAISALSPVVEKVAGRTKVLFDSGVRRGIDVFKALALGADAVGVGRPILYGLNVAGAEGVMGVLEHLKAELVNVMRLSGVSRLSEVRRELVSFGQA
jgi:L-lactate oxidase